MREILKQFLTYQNCNRSVREIYFSKTLSLKNQFILSTLAGTRYVLVYLFMFSGTLNVKSSWKMEILNEGVDILS
jgi:hypothetical protein